LKRKWLNCEFLVNFEILLIYKNYFQSPCSSQGSVSFADLGPKALKKPKAVSPSKTKNRVIPIETAGSAEDDKDCINFDKIVNKIR